MKKILTIILSVLLMTTCFTVNTFAENENEIAEIKTDTTQTLNESQENGGGTTPAQSITQGYLSSNDERIIDGWYDNVVYSWIVLVDPAHFYSENSISISLECADGINFSQPSDVLEKETITRDDNNITTTLSKYNVTPFIAINDSESQIHEFIVVLNYQKSFLNNLDGVLSLEVVKDLSSFDSSKDLFSVLSLSIGLNSEKYSIISDRILKQELDNIENGIYDISFNNNSSIDKDCGIDYIDGFTLPYITYQVSVDGFTENIILNFYENNHGGQESAESAISSASVVYGGKKIPLTYNFNNNAFEWRIDWSRVDEGQSNEFFDFINSDGFLKVEYEVDGKTHILEQLNFGYVQELYHYGVYGYIEESGQNHYFLLEPSFPVFDWNDYDSVKVIGSNNKETYISRDVYETVDEKRYYKSANGFFDEAGVKIQFIKNEEIIDEFPNIIKDQNYFNGIEYISQGIDVYDVQSGCLAKLCSNFEINSPADDSFIIPNNNNYDIYKDEYSNIYYWNFHLSFDEYISNSHDISFSNNTSSEITFTPASDYENNFVINTSGSTITIKSLNNNQTEFIVKAANNETQKHFINFQCNNDEILQRTAISNFTSSYGDPYYDLYNSTYNSNTNLFDDIYLNLSIQANELSNLANKIENKEDINLEKYFNIAFDGWTLNNGPEIKIEYGSFGRMVHIIYNVEKDSNKQSINIILSKAASESDKSIVKVGGKEYYLEEYGGTKVYISESRNGTLEFDLREVVNAANNSETTHSVLFLDYNIYSFNHNNNTNSQNSLIYFDGYEMEKDIITSLNLYYLDNPDLLNSGDITNDNLVSISTYNSPIKTRFMLSSQDYYDDLEIHGINNERRKAYSINNGNFSYPMDIEDTNTNNQGINTWVSYNISDDKTTIDYFINTKYSQPGSIVYYMQAFRDPGEIKENKTLYLGQVTEENGHYPATADGLKAAMDELRDSDFSSIVLLEDITLDKDVYLKHDRYAGSDPEETPKADVNINLNGHSINTGENGYSIINLRNSAIHITNTIIDKNNSTSATSVSGGVISGNSNNPLIINYGSLYIFDDVSLSNANGTAILSYNSGNGYISSGTTINAKICIQLEENELFADGRLNSRFSIKGNLKASEVAILSNSRESEIVNIIDLYYDAVSTTHSKVVSNDIGIKTTGNVEINVTGVDVFASQPYVIGGGILEIRNSTAKALDMSTYDKSNEQLSTNPVILVDSTNQYATNTSILLATGNKVIMKTAGPIIRENVTQGSKIDKVYFYSINNKDDSYFDYENNKLFYFNPKADAFICIEGGCFSDESFVTYLPNPQFYYKGIDGNYFYNNKECYKEVKNFSELEAALQDVNVQQITLSNSINGASTGSEVIFTVNTPKVLFLNGHNIENVKFVPKTTNANAAKALFTIDGCYKGENTEVKTFGTIRNSGNVIESTAKELFVVDANIISNDNTAIIIHGGSMYIKGENNKLTIEGKEGIVINNEGSSLNIDNLSITNAKVTGNNGPAIVAAKTNKFVYFDIQDESEIKTLLNDGSLNSSAIRIKDQVRLSSMGNVTLKGGKYGVYFDDGLPGGGFVNYYAGLQLDDVNVYADIAFRMGDKTVSHLTKTNVEAKSAIMEIHGFTQYMITGGNYKVIDKTGSIFTFIGISPTANYNWHVIEGGNYSHFVADHLIFNASYSEYQYKCLAVDIAGNKNILPYKVARKKKENRNYQFIEAPADRDIIIDEGKLDNAFNETGERIDVVLTVKYKNDPATKDKFDKHGNGFKEYYDIHVDKSVNGVAVENINETDNYQLIKIPLNSMNIDGENINYMNVEKVKVYHHHNDKVSTIKKINPSKANMANEECYYINNENGQWYLNIIAKQFSDFAIQELTDSDPVIEEGLKPNYVLNLQYNNLYSGYTEDLPTKATYGENGEIGINDVNVVYTNLYNNTTSSTFPSEVGDYKVEWTVKDEKDITGKGSANFRILDVDLNNISQKQNLVYNTYPQELIEVNGSVNNYRFEVTDFEGTTTVFEGKIPTATNAGEYTVKYSKNNVVIEICKVTVEKATPSYTLPTNLTATYGNKLSSITLPLNQEGTPGKYTFANPNNYVGNAGTNEVEIVFTPNDTDNYNIKNDKVTIVVEKATPTVSHPAIKATYGDTFGSIKLENRFSFKDKISSDIVGNAGEYNVTLTYTPEDSNNYKSVDVNVKLTVEKAYPSKVVDIPSIKPVDKGTLLREISLDGTSFKWKDENAVVSDTNVALYTKDENHKTIEVNIPIAIKKTILVNGSNIKAVFTSSANNNASTTLPNTATTVTISNNALTSNAEKVVNRILNDNLGKIEIGENDVNDIKNIVSGVMTNDSYTLVVETVLNKEEKKIEEIDGESFNKISSALNGNEVLSLFDLKVNLNVSSKDSSNSVIDSSTTTISVLEVPLEIRIDVDTDELPVAPENKQIEYFVIPLHDGVALDPIPATLINGKLVFVANKFSYYTLSYKLVDIPTIPSSSGSGNRKPVVNTASH